MEHACRSGAAPPPTPAAHARRSSRHQPYKTFQRTHRQQIAKGAPVAKRAKHGRWSRGTRARGAASTQATCSNLPTLCGVPRLPCSACPGTRTKLPAVQGRATHKQRRKTRQSPYTYKHTHTYKHARTQRCHMGSESQHDDAPCGRGPTMCRAQRPGRARKAWVQRGTP
jgi:hypothetical protein